MKKLFFILFCFICSLNVFSQNQRDSIQGKIVLEHMKFMGIPMEGPIGEFSNKIISKGFSFEMINDNNLTVLKGNFAGHMAHVLLQPNRDNEIYRVQLLFSDSGSKFISWEELSNVYFDLKELLISKYGEPKYCNENFVGKKPKKDKDKIIAVLEGNCVYECGFDLTGLAKYISKSITVKGMPMSIGNIGLSIGERVVLLTYVDIQQEMKQKDQNFDDI